MIGYHCLVPLIFMCILKCIEHMVMFIYLPIHFFDNTYSFPKNITAIIRSGTFFLLINEFLDIYRFQPILERTFSDV